MEEKFLEEMQMLLEEKKELCEQSKRISKKYSNYGLLSICSMILMEYFINFSAVCFPFFLYYFKKAIETDKIVYKMLKDIRTKKFITETTCYKELLIEYKELILRLSDMLDKNKINSLVDIQSTFVFMQKNGYLSENHNWMYENLWNSLYLENKGISIINGGGCCRDLSKMLNDILESRNFCTTTLSMILETERDYELLYSVMSIEELCENINVYIKNLPILLVENEEKISLETKEEKHKRIKKSRKNFFNHTIVSTEYNRQVYHFDPTNHLYFNRYDKKHVTFYGDDNPLWINYKEVPAEKKHLLELASPDQKELYQLYNEYYIKNLLERERIFQDFYESNKECYQRINRKVDLISKYW